MSYQLLATNESPEALLAQGWFYGGYGNGFAGSVGTYKHLYCSPGQTQSQCQLAAIAGQNSPAPPAPGGAIPIAPTMPVLYPGPGLGEPTTAGAPGGAGCCGRCKGGGAGPVTIPGQPGPVAPAAPGAPSGPVPVARGGVPWWLWVLAILALASSTRNG